MRIKVEAVGLNFADVFTALGMYDAAPRGQPVIPGLEFSGIVEEVGERINKQKPQVEVQRSEDGKRQEDPRRIRAAAHSHARSTMHRLLAHCHRIRQMPLVLFPCSNLACDACLVDAAGM